MKYLTYDKNYWALDIEADNLLEAATRIWCVCVENIVTGESHDFTDQETFREWLGRNGPDVVLVGHNIISYDLPMLNRHWGTRLGVGRVIDTYVLSQLYNPRFPGGHSLEAWGVRLKFPKGECNDFSCYSKPMLEYCRNDVTLTRRLYIKLAARMVAVGFSELGVEIENLAWNIIQNKQRRHGFPFNKKKAEELYAILRSRQAELETEIYKLWPPEFRVVREFKNPTKKNGEPSAFYKRHLEQYPKLEIIEGRRYRAYDWVEFNIGSPPQRVSKLLELGWTPTEFTEKGQPQVNEESLLAFAELSGSPEVTAIAKWLVVNSRGNMVRTWLDAYNEETGAIHGKLFIASTLRYRHSNPNSANVPALRKNDKKEILYGEEGTWAYECRDLFIAPEGHRLIGVDAKGIQLRVLCNYAYSKEFEAIVLDGDPHTNNIKILGLANKAAAKKFLYTTLMGGGGPKLAADQAQFGTRLSPAQGNELKRKLIESVPGFKELIKELIKELHDAGRIRLCDGTPILVPSDHMVIPYLLQGDESRIMKKAMIELDKEIRREKLEAYKVADIHDEWQFVVSNRDVERFMALAEAVFIKVGEFFGYRLPIEGEAKEGLTWAETH